MVSRENIVVNNYYDIYYYLDSIIYIITRSRWSSSSFFKDK